MNTKEEFFLKKFMYNNYRIVIFSLFLTIEQMWYGIFIRESGSFLQKVHFCSAAMMFFYSIISIYFQYKKSEHLIWIHKIYEIGFGILGFMIAIIRALFIQDHIFQLPTIYIAVIYGFAAIFYFNPIKSFFIYSLTSIILILLLPVFQPMVVGSSYIQDIIANNIIAWITSIFNYRKYFKEYINEKTISINHEALREKTLEIAKMNEKLQKLSVRDDLTNIYNRRKLDEILECECSRANQYSNNLSVIFIDVDFFKGINDTYGHIVGDKVLIELAVILKRNIRDTDMIGRWGGEEFLVICPETDMIEAISLSEKLRTAVARYHFTVIDQRTCSFGVATYKENDTIKGLMSRADEGLYQAKKRGRNCVEAVS